MAGREAPDPRWDGAEPLFQREHNLSPEVGDWDKFFTMVSHRIEQVILYGESGASNPAWIADRLVSDSLNRFSFDRRHAIHEEFRKFFSPSEIAENVRTELWSDLKVKEASAELETKQRMYASTIPIGKGLFVAPLRKSAEVVAAERKLNEVCQQRLPVCRAKILVDRLWVLESFFNMILSDPEFFPKGIALFAKLRSDVRKYCFDAKISYDVAEDGTIIRFGPEPLGRMVTESIFNTGDSELDQLLQSARQKLRDKNPQIYRESLEKLWDAWERLKTVEGGQDKKASSDVLFSKLSVGAEFSERVRIEAKELTDVGNKFRIRHSETNKIPIGTDAEVEYLFYRLFSLIWLILKKTGRLSVQAAKGGV